MIGHFPSPYPDESLYSLSARFSERVEYGSSKAILQELYGSHTATAVTFLPNRLAYLAGALPQGTSLSVNCLIDRYTIFPFFGGFLPPARVEGIRKDMAEGKGASVYMRAGCMASRVKMAGALRFCMACKLEDETNFGETYWHRTHQLPGIDVCWQHGTNLQNSIATTRCGRNSLLFISAKTATKTIEFGQGKIQRAQNTILLKLARDAAWLLKNSIPGTTHSALQNRYLQLLIDNELATYTTSIHTTRLLAKFLKFYPDQLLGQMNCQFRGRDQQKTNWLLRVVRTPRHSLHPLYHLLVIQFLGISVQDFFRLPDELKFFGDGPWPCLNKTADHFGESVIHQCRLSNRTRDNRPTGNFKCSCGFSYSRSGPDQNPEDRYRVGRMLSFGPVWESQLKKNWNSQTLSLSAIGRSLGVDPLTVKRHAARLNLTLVKRRKVKPLPAEVRLLTRETIAEMKAKRDSFRHAWVGGWAATTPSTIKSVRKRLPTVYAWLLQNDYAWLKRNRPKPNVQRTMTHSVDWGRRDKEYAVGVQGAAKRLKTKLGRPIRITRTAIARDLGAISLFQKHLNQMPITNRTLTSLLETADEFSIRRVWWAANNYLQEGVTPKEWQLSNRANIPARRVTDGIRKAVAAAIESLASKDSAKLLALGILVLSTCRNVSE